MTVEAAVWQPVVPAPSPAEDLLVSRAAAGDHEAFAELATAHRLFVYRIAMRILQDHHAAEDVVQDVFVLAWRALPKLRHDRALRAWLYRVATNAALSQLRRQRIQPAILTSDLVDPSASPSEALEQAEYKVWLANALATLPGVQREALILRFQQGLSYQEIAAVTQSPLGTVKSTLSRGIKRLQRTFAPTSGRAQ